MDNGIWSGIKNIAALKTHLRKTSLSKPRGQRTITCMMWALAWLRRHSSHGEMGEYLCISSATCMEL